MNNLTFFERCRLLLKTIDVPVHDRVRSNKFPQAEILLHARAFATLCTTTGTINAVSTIVSRLLRNKCGIEISFIYSPIERMDETIMMVPCGSPVN